MKRVGVLLVAIALAPATVASSPADADALTADALGVAGADPLRHWVQGLDIPLPAGATHELPMGMGNFTLTTGRCWDMQIGDLGIEDSSANLTLEFALNLSGIEIVCEVEGDNDGSSLLINVTVGRSGINTAVRIEPTTSMMAPELPVPLGNVTLTECAADLQVVAISFGGDSPIVMLTGSLPGDMLAGMVGGFLNEPLCDGLRQVVAEKGASNFEMAAMLVGPVMLPPWPLFDVETLKPTLDWSRYPPVQVIQALVAERFKLWADRVIDILDVTEFNSVLYQDANVTLKLRDLSVNGVAGREGLGLAIRADDSHLGVDVGLEGLAMNSQFELRLTFPGQPELVEHIGLTLDLHNISMGVRAFVDESMLDQLQVSQALESPKCLVDCAAGTVENSQDAIAVEQMEVSLRPLLNVSAPGSLETDITRFANVVVRALYNGYMPTVNALVNGGLGIARNPLNELLWKKLNALPPCKESAALLGVNEDVVQSFWILAFAAAGCAVISGLVYQCISDRRVRRRRARELEAGAEAGGSQGHDVDAAQAVIPEVSLCHQPLVPRSLAAFYPVALVAVAFLFMYSDFGLGATVTVRMKAGEGETVIGPIFSFSLVSTIVHAWDAGSYFISLLTLLLSGVWPYIKLLMLFVAWVAPPQKLSPKRRGHLLKFLDTWGKYSFVDSWFLVLSMSAFSIQWSAIGDSDASLMVQTNPRYAFYAFFVATASSLVLGHVASQYHTELLVTEMSMQRAAKKASGEQTLAAMEDAAAKPASIASLVESRSVRIAGNVALAVTIVATIVGTFVMSFNFQVSGVFTEFLFGYAVDKEFSLWTVGMNVASGRYSEGGLVALEFVFMVLSVFLPLVMLATLAVLWNASLTARGQQRILRFCYFLESWTSLDVAVLVLIVAIFEFEKLSEFLVYRSNFAIACNMVRDITRSECMLVQLHGQPVMLLLLAAGILNIIVPKVLTRIAARTASRRIGAPILPGTESVMGVKPCSPKSYQGVLSFGVKDPPKPRTPAEANPSITAEAAEENA
mmetsp:Transcript_12135/g.34773  ORF Transcript_12135/g.34773 Transcript_12135/m.34773 type:complete len:1026 (+) Transcript_12135:118-3195(+)